MKLIPYLLFGYTEIKYTKKNNYIFLNAILLKIKKNGLKVDT